MPMYKLKCKVTSRIPVVPDDPLKYKLKKNGSSDIEAFIEGNWIKIGFVNVWPDKIHKPSIMFKTPNPYELTLFVNTRP